MAIQDFRDDFDRFAVNVMNAYTGRMESKDLVVSEEELIKHIDSLDEAEEMSKEEKEKLLARLKKLSKELSK